MPEEMTWETNELLNWLINEEALYEESTNLAGRHRGPDLLKEWASDMDWTPTLGTDFDWSEVDWQVVADNLIEED